MTHQDILRFWFEETPHRAWWTADPAFDALIRERFGELLRRAAQGECEAWRSKPRGRLAEIVLLDQFSRNVYRGSPQAFAQDGMALVLAQEAVSRGELAPLSGVERGFLLLPYMHSESRLVHQCAEQLYREHALDDNYQFELRHKTIIDRFGRYPHRNAVLGRVSTAEELEFLQQAGSSF
ncbi:DUF924 family protein [Paucibacter soli]|uniref:DUF924 family protein n=1 Tax=Paucibacter soli TaxID=3133433 RepID=UPI0030B0E816